MSEAESARTFEFRFQDRYRPALAALGVTPGTASITVDDDAVHIRFGLRRCTIALDNIKCVQVSGPYRGYRAIGIRGSFADTGITFGTTTEGGTCIEFKERIAVVDPTGLYKNAALTVTVADPQAFADYIRQAAHLDN